VTSWVAAGAAALSGTINEIAYFDSGTTIASLAVATYPSLTELSYVKGLSSAIQTQLGTKAPSTAPTFATSITGSYLTASEILITGASKEIISAAVATYPSLTELSYVKGLSSAVQTQFSGKAATGQTFFIGTTQVAINRASATLNLAGIGTLGVGAITSSGTLDLGANNLTMTGSLGATGAGKLTKIWATDAEFTNLPTINSGTLATALNLSGTNTGDNTVATALTGTPSITVNGIITTGTIDIGHADQNTLSGSGGVLSIQGVAIPTISSTNTLTNKEITKRVVTTASDTTAVIDVDVTDVYELTAVGAPTTFTLTGTPTDGQMLIVRYKDDATPRALTWTGFTALGITLPTTTTTSKWDYVGCTYNLNATAWHCIATVTEE